MITFTPFAFAVADSSTTSPRALTLRWKLCVAALVACLLFRTARLRAESVSMSERNVSKRVAKKLNTPTRDVTGKWRKRVHEMADRLGWQRSALWDYFEEMALMCEYELKLGRPIAEESGYRLLRGTVDKTECGGEIH